MLPDPARLMYQANGRLKGICIREGKEVRLNMKNALLQMVRDAFAAMAMKYRDFLKGKA